MGKIEEKFCTEISVVFHFKCLIKFAFWKFTDFGFSKIPFFDVLKSPEGLDDLKATS